MNTHKWESKRTGYQGWVMDRWEHGQLVFQKRIIDSDIAAKDTGVRKVFKTALVFSWFGENAHCRA